VQHGGCTIGINAAQHDNPARNPAERAHQRVPVCPGAGDHVNHDVGGEAAQLGRMLVEAVAIAG
jgi:hypothetical protein